MAQREHFTEDDLMEQTLRADVYTEVAYEVGTSVKNFVHGYGGRNRQDADSGYTYGDFIGAGHIPCQESNFSPTTSE